MPLAPEAKPIYINADFFGRWVIRLNLTGQTAFVGGASKGIGKAIAHELADLGARVIAMARSEEALNKLVNMLPGEGHMAFVADAGDSNALRVKAQELIQQVGTINILVCNSGGPAAGPLIDAEPEALLQGFTQHVVANQILAQTFVPKMKEAGSGRIINVISISVKEPIPNLGVSNTVRGAVANWAKTLASELGPHGITVNNVLPGFHQTDRLDALKKANSQRFGISEGEVEEKWINAVPVGRIGDPQDFAEVVAFLSGPAAGYINGINLPVDGGRLVSL